jgi:sugar transferase (PEP-CTERM/EpsH1 system associated)
VPARRITRIINGVDVERFRPPESGSRRGLPKDFASATDLVIGTVGRLEPIKDQRTLVRAFVELAGRFPELRGRLRLVLVGDGSTKRDLQELLGDSGLAGQVWFAGSREDVPQLMQAMDVFVLPSLAEGISNTVMEAMASGLPVVATDVGGNAELVVDGETGFLVPRDDPPRMATALSNYLRKPEIVEQHGQAARNRAEQAFSLAVMVDSYRRVYRQVTGIRSIE